jgi:hypothetical protein
MTLRDAGLRSREKTPHGDRSARPPAADPTPTDAPRGLLWSTGAIALILAVAAFLLWGRNGTAWILDLIVAFCG